MRAHGCSGSSPSLALLVVTFLLMSAISLQQPQKNASEASAADISTGDSPPSEVLALPSPASQEATGAVPTLTVGGKIALDALGPAIVGEDGTLRRIANWANLTEREQQVALRRIGQRNQARLAALKQQQQEQQYQQEQLEGKQQQEQREQQREQQHGIQLPIESKQQLLQKQQQQVKQEL
ncbi:hypothetical protein Agub_g12929 [Astrephomene gubernaculifera]|uniref:Uncharacterized protein n=1 Tax=Astrephomene gubernaculifera TaxID=47775 RepID=A0AAD3HRY7_9CHLO|nr:hypothetical protein Agub_g12929 [Astrephomene gubernaculifera]